MRRVMIISGTESLASVRRFLASREPKMAKSALGLWRRQTGMVSKSDIGQMLATAQVPAALLEAWMRTNDEWVHEAAVPNWIEGFEFTAANISKRLKRILGKSDIQTSSLVQQWVQERGGLLITRLDDEILGVINGLLKKYVIEEPLSPFQLARLIRPHIGLTEKWSQAVQNRYESLIDTGISMEEALAETDRYATFLHKVRAMNIARTELAEAYGEGQWSALIAAKNEGLVGDRIVKTWATADDERVCEICGGLDGEQRDIDKPYSNGKQHAPAHNSCRCSDQHELIRGS